MHVSTIGQSARDNSSPQSSSVKARRLADGLGWFSIGLGLTEVVAPGAVANLIGIKNETKTRNLLRSYGVRELVAGVGILTNPRPAGWVWSRVAGDMLDLASLGSALQSNVTNKTRVATAAAAVLGVTALDVICGQQLSDEKAASGMSDTKVIKTIIVDCSPEVAYNFWHELDNLPKFMTYLKSVSPTADRRSHWIAKGPGGMEVEWDAETTFDVPNQEIGWHSTEGNFKHTGCVRFEEAPGARGTLVRVEMDYGRTGALASAMSAILGADLGRRISHDLRNFKQVIELGEVTQSDASIHEGAHPAQPPDELPSNGRSEFGLRPELLERSSV